MKKLLLATIIAGLWLIGCSKTNPVEPDDGGGNVVINDSSATCVIMSRLGFTYTHYVRGEQNIDTAGFKEPFKYQCDYIKFVRYEDSAHFVMRYAYKESELFAKNNGDLTKNGWVIKKIIWKRF